MTHFPEVLIVKYYEGGTFIFSYSDDSSYENIKKIYTKLDIEMIEDKHLESFDVVIKGENINKL